VKKEWSDGEADSDESENEEKSENSRNQRRSQMRDLKRKLLRNQRKTHPLRSLIVKGVDPKMIVKKVNGMRERVVL